MKKRILTRLTFDELCNSSRRKIEERCRGNPEIAVLLRNVKMNRIAGRLLDIKVGNGSVNIEISSSKNNGDSDVIKEGNIHRRTILLSEHMSIHLWESHFPPL